MHSKNGAILEGNILIVSLGGNGDFGSCTTGFQSLPLMIANIVNIIISNVLQNL